MKISRSAAAVLAVAVVLVLFDRHYSSDDPGAGSAVEIAGITTTAAAVNESAAQDTDAANVNIGESRHNAITHAVENVTPAVVGISTKGVQRYRSALFDDPVFRQWFPPQIYEREVGGLGSGFLISADGYIVTNDHVVENAREINVTLTNRQTYQASLVNRDFASDIALLKIDGDDFPYIEMGDSEDILIGEWVIAFGNPFGLFEINDQPSVTVGVVSATGRDFGKYMNNRYYNGMIQTDASINPGNSGGPLVNGLGKVIGVNAFIVTGSASEQGSVGIGFAIPINKVKEVVENLKATADEDPSYYTGLEVYPINRLLQIQLGLRTRDGAVITKVDAASPGEKAGLRPGDVITAIDDTRLRTPEEMLAYLHKINLRPGKQIKIQVIRDNRVYETTLTLERPPGDK